MQIKGEVFGINGPIVEMKGSKSFKMSEMVLIGREKLLGEVINIYDDKVIVQVFESTEGLTTGEEVIATGEPVSLSLAPGIMGNIFDGIQRPLKLLEEQTGDFIKRGFNVDVLDKEKKWHSKMLVKNGDYLSGGDFVAEVRESNSIIHKILVPPGIKGLAKKVQEDGDYNIEETLLELHDDKKIHKVKMLQKWPIKKARPYKERCPISKPLLTGQRVIDTLFPIAKGGTAALPGGFGTGKTMTQHQLAKYCDADIIVYIGCGERGNEMTQVLEEFAALEDPRTGNLLLDRTVLIANTSNMPVAAREASIYTGLTIAEYYRDMGYHVAIMADSTSRWAEALRELSGRMEEMPAEEGFPAYLASRLAQFYERAAYVKNFNGTEGSLSLIGAVSPQGGDFSEPVTLNTKRFVRCFWTLDRALAYSRHYPAVQWLSSYSEYIEDLKPWYEKHLSKDFLNYRQEILNILNEESSLNEIVKLIGADVLHDKQKLILEIARITRVGFVQQNAFHRIDTFVPLQKQLKMMELILYLYKKSEILIDMDIPMSVLKKENIFEKVIMMKFEIENDDLNSFDEYKKDVDNFYNKIYEENI